MRYLLLILAAVGMMAGSVLADDSTKPNLIFTPESCMLRVTPQDGTLLEGWSICVTDRHDIGTFHESDEVECDQVVAITPHYSIDMAPYVDNCSVAVPNEKMSFGALKSYYR